MSITTNDLLTIWAPFVGDERSVGGSETEVADFRPTGPGGEFHDGATGEFRDGPGGELLDGTTP